MKNSKLKPKDKVPEVGQKRARSSSVADGPQRIPLAAKPTALVVQATSLPQRPPLAHTLIPQRVFSQPEPTVVHIEGVAHFGGPDDDMEVEDSHDTRPKLMDDVLIVGDEELEKMIDEQDRAEVIENLVPTEDADEVLEYIWPDVSPNRAARYQQEVDKVEATFDAQDEEYDDAMCSEYAEEIFQYMGNLQVRFQYPPSIPRCLDF
jgi:G2/mitotic-specific cyclin 2